MPVMDGISATKEIRRLEKLNASQGYPGTPQTEGQRTPSDISNDSRVSSSPFRSSVIIVALTASSLQSDRVAALAAGCNDFLTKPVSLEWLNSKIIEWGSIKALQMFADSRPDFVKSVSAGQAVQAQNIARRLHMPEGRVSPSPSRTFSQPGASSGATSTSTPSSSNDPTVLGKSSTPSLLYKSFHETLNGVSESINSEYRYFSAPSQNSDRSIFSSPPWERKG
jgi:osomolarity two-component system, response regulator SSK1